MENTNGYRESANMLFAKAKADLAANMQQRNIGAVIWDNARTGFKFIPEIVHRSEKKDKTRVAEITGLYLYQGTIYLIEQDRSGVSVDTYYNPDTDVKPTVVTLSENRAQEDLGDPDAHKGFTTQGSLEEWLTIADCYFEALEERIEE